MNDEIRANVLIESGASLREIARCFSTPLDGFRYYAGVVHNQFTPAQAVAKSECGFCQHTADDSPRQIIWRAVAHDRASGVMSLVSLIFGQITSRSVEVKFTTAHRYCVPCARRLWWSFSMLRLAKSALFAVLLIALFATVPLIVFTGAVLFYQRDLLLGSGLSLVAGLVLLGLLYLCFRWLWTSAVPAHLQFIARFPFEPLSIRKIDESVM